MAEERRKLVVVFFSLVISLNLHKSLSSQSFVVLSLLLSFRALAAFDRREAFSCPSSHQSPGHRVQSFSLHKNANDDAQADDGGNGVDVSLVVGLSLPRSDPGLGAPSCRLRAVPSLSSGSQGPPGTEGSNVVFPGRTREGREKEEERGVVDVEMRETSSWPLAKRERANQSRLLTSPRFLPLPLFFSLRHSPHPHSQVVARDYPRPDIDNSGPFVEAAQLSSSLAASARPAKPLKVVIAGAGKRRGLSVSFFLSFLCPRAIDENCISMRSSWYQNWEDACRGGKTERTRI